MQLIEHFKFELTRYPQNKVEEVVSTIVESSSFQLATCLALAAWFQERSTNDLTNHDILKKYTKKYSAWGVTILNSIESDYLATILMETNSFHEEKSPFSIALEHNLIDFLSSDRVGRIGHAMWVKPNLLEPDTSENFFVMKGTSFTEVNERLIKNPTGFYLSPLGFYTLEIFLYIIYLILFTGLSIRRGNVYDPIEMIDIVFWVANAGYIFKRASRGIFFDGRITSTHF